MRCAPDLATVAELAKRYGMSEARIDILAQVVGKLALDVLNSLQGLEIEKTQLQK